MPTAGDPCIGKLNHVMAGLKLHRVYGHICTVGTVCLLVVNLVLVYRVMTTAHHRTPGSESLEISQLRVDVAAAPARRRSLENGADLQAGEPVTTHGVYHT